MHAKPPTREAQDGEAQDVGAPELGAPERGAPELGALYLATHNEHKVEELQALLGPRWQVKSARDLEIERDCRIQWNETGQTFEENARIKAAALSTWTDAAILADDSGLVVDSLGGRPGVHSSRFAEVPEGTPRPLMDQKNLQRLLSEMANIPEERRTARFICCLFFLPARNSSSSQECRAADAHQLPENGMTILGTCEGQIATQPEGTNGFGYDPVFLVKTGNHGRSVSLANLSAAEKNKISHRANAVTKLIDLLDHFFDSKA